MRQPPSIDSYGGGGFRVSGVWRPGSLLIIDDAPRAWRPRSLAELTPDDFAPVIAAGTTASEFVLLGTGAVQAQPPKDVRRALLIAGLGLEFMSTPAAARDYGVLMSEGRRVAVALIAT
jgi:uncharacterized protein